MSAIVRLRPADREIALNVVRLNPATNVFLNHRLQNHPDGRIVDGEIFAATDPSPALLYIGGNAVPANLDSQNRNLVRSFADLLARETPPIGSIVGEATAVSAIWSELEPNWPLPARLIRANQPYLVSHTKFNSEINRVRFGNIADLSEYFDAARQMFFGEVGQMPPTAMFQARVAENLRSENAIGWFAEDGRVLFKLDIGAMADGWLQVQGVWLHPELRGQGLSTGLMSEAFSLIQRRFDVNLCLYVNDFNLPALRAYARLGFEQVGNFQTVFF
ncbi:MAG: hypothetical protein RL038_1053 [Actinomycetota bacterium]